jgi:fatty acid synthase
MDPQLRKLLEVAYEAWIDAGLDFSALRGSEKVGVYVGTCGSETHAQYLGDVDNITGYEQSGCARSMFANRLSWWFDFRGPSKCIDTGECFGDLPRCPDCRPLLEASCLPAE